MRGLPSAREIFVTRELSKLPRENHLVLASLILGGDNLFRRFRMLAVRRQAETLDANKTTKLAQVLSRTVNTRGGTPLALILASS